MKLIGLIFFLLTFCNLAGAREITVEGMTGSQILDAVGGPFDHAIPDFKGFKQDGNVWCWAAAAKNIYFYLTGAELDQAQLARIHFNDLPATQSWGDQIGSVSKSRCPSKKPLCNQRGLAEPALWQVGADAPLKDYPSGRIPTLIAIRKSLEQNVPVGLWMTWGDGRWLHEVIAYGAHFSSSADGSQFLLTLDIFDPSGGEKSVLTGTSLHPEFDIYDEWEGQVDLGDLSSRQVKQQACPFLTPQSRSQYCRKSK